MEKRYGWFSQEMYDQNGGHIYETLEGGQVLVTGTSRTEDHGIGFPDVRFVGMVGEHVERVERRKNRSEYKHKLGGPRGKWWER